MRDLGAEGEEAWATLRQHAEWAEGVWFGWVFVPAPLDVPELIGRFDALPTVAEASLVVPLTVPEIASQRLFSTEAQGRCAVWFVAEGPDPQPWISLHLLLNERRERIRRHLSGALIFAGRPEWKDAARTAAPDLWSQRLVVLEWPPAA